MVGELDVVCVKDECTYECWVSAEIVGNTRLLSGEWSEMNIMVDSNVSSTL